MKPILLEWHQSAWQYLNYLQGVQDERNEKHPVYVGTVDVAGVVPNIGNRVEAL